MKKKLCQVETPSEIWGQRIERQVKKTTKDKTKLLARELMISILHELNLRSNCIGTDSMNHLYNKLSMFVTCNMKLEVLKNEVDQLLDMFKDTKIVTKEDEGINPVANIFEFIKKLVMVKK